MHCWRGEENGLYYLFLLKYWTVALYWTLSWTIRYIENGEHDRNLFQKWKFPNFFYAPQLVLLKIDLKSSSNLKFAQRTDLSLTLTASRVKRD